MMNSINDDNLNNSFENDHESFLNSTMKEDFVQQMDMSLSVISSDLSWNDELQELNLNLAEKNKQILEQECKINELDLLVEKLTKQILRHKQQERKLKIDLYNEQAFCKRVQKENDTLKLKCGTVDYETLKLSSQKKTL